jgi:hypothetical protein
VPSGSPSSFSPSPNAQFVVDLFKKRFGKTPTHVDNVLYAVGGGLPGGTVDTVITVIDNGGPQSAPARKGKSCSFASS